MLAIFLLLLAIFFLLLTLLVPTILTPLNKAWFGLSILLGRVVSPITLSIIFFILITPVAIVNRIAGRDALLIKKRRVSSYWVGKDPIEANSFFNQF